MRIEGMIFDLDGTLGETLPVCFSAFRETFGAFLGREYDDHEIRAMFGPNEEGVLRNMLAERWEDGLRHFLDSYRRAHTLCPAPFPGIQRVLEVLTENEVRLAVVTGKGRQTTEISLHVLGFAGLFEPVVTGSPHGGVKPDCMRRVVASWECDPSNIACIGDSPSDIRAAREIGAASLAAAWSSKANAETLLDLGPDAVFHQVSGLGQWVQENVVARNE